VEDGNKNIKKSGKKHEGSSHGFIIIGTVQYLTGCIDEDEDTENSYTTCNENTQKTYVQEMFKMVIPARAKNNPIINPFGAEY